MARLRVNFNFADMTGQVSGATGVSLLSTTFSGWATLDYSDTSFCRVRRMELWTGAHLEHSVGCHLTSGMQLGHLPYLID